MSRRTKAQRDEWSRKRTQIVALYNSGGNWKGLAANLSVPEKTAYRWVLEGDRKDTRGGRRFRKITEEHCSFLESCIGSNPRITLEELVGLLFSQFGITVSITTINKHIKSSLYTVKSVKNEPEGANSEVNKEKRRNYVRQVLEYLSQGKPILYMDETNCNLHVSRRYGQALCGLRANDFAAGSRRANNVHMVVCISTMGLIHHEIHRGPFTKEAAQDWMRACLRAARVNYGSPVVIVMDSPSFYSQTDSLLLEPEFQGNLFLRIGPYSSMLNPIETIWSKVKAHVRKNITSRIESVLNNNSENLHIAEHRLRVLELLMSEAISSVEAVDCTNCILGVSRYFAPSLELADVSF